MANCIYKYKGKDYTKEQFYSLVSNSNFIQQEQAKKFAESNKIGEQIEESDKHFSNPDLPPFEVMEYVYNRNKDEDLPSNPPTCI